MNSKIKDLFIIVLIILLGLLSRKIFIIPNYFGDILWAVMIFFIIRIFTKKIKYLITLSLIICFGIEFSQLIDFEILNILRKNYFGKLVFGQTFLYFDLIAYFIGILISVFLVNIKTSFKFYISKFFHIIRRK